MKKLLLLLSLLLALSSQANAAPVVAASASVSGTSTNSLPVNITPSGGSRLLLAAVFYNRTTNNPTVSDCNFGGTPLTVVGVSRDVFPDAVEFWALVAPAASSAIVTCNFTTQADAAFLYVTAFSSVDQTTPHYGFVKDSGGNNADSFSVTSATGDLVYAIWSTSNNNLTIAAGTGGNFAVGGLMNAYIREYAGAASVLIEWTGSNTNAWDAAGVSIKSVSTGTNAGVHRRIN